MRVTYSVGIRGGLVLKGIGFPYILYPNNNNYAVLTDYRALDPQSFIT